MIEPTDSDRQEIAKRAEAVLSLIESDFGQSGRDVRLMAIMDELEDVWLGRREQLTPEHASKEPK